MNPRGTFARPHRQPHFVKPWTELVAKQVPFRKVKEKQDKKNHLHPTSKLLTTARSQTELSCEMVC